MTKFNLAFGMMLGGLITTGVPTGEVVPFMELVVYSNDVWSLQIKEVMGLSMFLMGFPVAVAKVFSLLPKKKKPAKAKPVPSED